MSMTSSIGVVGPRHYSLAAKYMQGSLQRIITEGSTRGKEIHRSAYIDLKDFFDYLEEQITRKERNPPASANANMIATFIANRRIPDFPKDYYEKESKLKQYCEFFRDVLNPDLIERQLSETELKVAKELSLFFDGMYKSGERENTAYHADGLQWEQRNRCEIFF